MLLLFSTLGPGSARAGEAVVAVQSVRVQPYEEALKGFKSVYGGEFTRLVLAETGGGDVAGRIKALRPDLVLAVGMGALRKVKEIEDTPVVYIMVLNPRAIVAGKNNVTGVIMNIPQEKQLLTLREALPDVETVGLLYDPKRTGLLVKKARAAARKTGVALIAREVHSSKAVPSAIKQLAGKIDVFWMLPDITVVSPDSVEFSLLFFLENGIPVLTFSERYAEMGALMSIGIDAFDIGSQAGEMAKKVLSQGGKVDDQHQVDARKAVITINLKIAGKLGIAVDEKVLRKARVIN